MPSPFEVFVFSEFSNYNKTVSLNPICLSRILASVVCFTQNSSTLQSITLSMLGCPDTSLLYPKQDVRFCFFSISSAQKVPQWSILPNQSRPVELAPFPKTFKLFSEENVYKTCRSFYCNSFDTTDFIEISFKATDTSLHQWTVISLPKVSANYIFQRRLNLILLKFWL